MQIFSRGLGLHANPEHDDRLSNCRCFSKAVCGGTLETSATVAAYSRAAYLEPDLGGAAVEGGLDHHEGRLSDVLGVDHLAESLRAALEGGLSGSGEHVACGLCRLSLSHGIAG